MALDFQKIYAKLRLIGSQARQRSEKLNDLRRHTRRLLDTWVDKQDQLCETVDRARQHDPALRCAIPLNEHLDVSHAAPILPSGVTLIAADGSQVAPDHHAPLLYCLVNVGAVVLQLDSGHPPEVFTDSRLLFDDEVYTRTGMLTEEALALDRDLNERQKLLDLAKEYPAPLVALTDGPIELWGAKNFAEQGYQDKLQKHLSILSQLQERDVIVAGYVDKPGADLVVRLLEIADMSEDELKKVRDQRPLRGVTDRWMFSSLLSPGHRSAVFGLQSVSRAHYSGSLGLHFFYLNVGDERHPYPVRVEIPAWVAEQKGKIDLLHAVLLQQCGIMGAKPYPYLLHRAHEVALISHQEKQQVEQMLILELYRSGGEMEQESAKQSAKNLPGRSKRQ